jgi:hypothetical protein
MDVALAAKPANKMCLPERTERWAQHLACIIEVWGLVVASGSLVCHTAGTLLFCAQHAARTQAQQLSSCSMQMCITNPSLNLPIMYAFHMQASITPQYCGSVAMHCYNRTAAARPYPSCQLCAMSVTWHSITRVQPG